MLLAFTPTLPPAAVREGVPGGGKGATARETQRAAQEGGGAEEGRAFPGSPLALTQQPQEPLNGGVVYSHGHQWALRSDGVKGCGPESRTHGPPATPGHGT